MSTQWLTVPEVAERLSISEKAVRRRIERDTLPSQRSDDGRVRVPLSALEEDSTGEPPAGNRPRLEGNAASLMPPDISPLVERIEKLAAENATFRLLTEQAESLHAQRDEELHRVRAENLELRAKLEDLDETRTKLARLEADPPRRGWKRWF